MLIIPSISFGQTPNETNDIEMDFVLVESGNDINIDELIDEFKAIVSTPKQERTIEQWERAIEILFLIYFNADLKTLFNSLQNEIEKYQSITNQLETLIAELQNVYEEQTNVYLNIKTIQDNLTQIYQYYKEFKNEDNFHICLLCGYTINIGMNIGIETVFPIGNIFLIGGLVTLSTNFKDELFFSISLLIGWRF